MIDTINSMSPMLRWMHETLLMLMICVGIVGVLGLIGWAQHVARTNYWIHYDRRKLKR